MPTRQELVTDIRHVWPEFWPAILAPTLLMLLTLHRPEVYRPWTTEQLWQQLRPLGVKPRKVRLRDHGPRTRGGIRWADIATAPAQPIPAHVNDQYFHRPHPKFTNPYTTRGTRYGTRTR